MLKNKSFSLTSKGLRYKLKISFYLMSVLPLLVCIYLVSSHILPRVGIKPDIVFFLMISIFIVAIGFYVIKEVIDRILSVSTEAKLIAEGDINRRLEVTAADEVSDLAGSLNKITQGVRSNMDELKSYTQRTSQINLEIQRHVLALSSLLQISSLISQSARLDDILKFALEKSRIISDSDAAYLLYRDEPEGTFKMKAAEGIDSQTLLRIKIEPGGGIFAKLIQTNKPLILDKENVSPQKLILDFYKIFNLKNTLALPIILRGRLRGILGIGNRQKSFLYGKDDIGFLDIMSKHLAIAIENDILMHRLGKLEVRDALTGLYNEAFIRNRLDEEIRRAIIYRRPCAFILIEIDNFAILQAKFGLSEVESALKKIASLVKECVSEVDRVARLEDSLFGVVLPEKNKRRAQDIAHQIKQKIESSFSKEPDLAKRLTVSVGTSENPVDGVEAEELMQKAKEALKK